MEQKGLNFPEHMPLNRRKKELPFFLSDETFAVVKNCMKVYPGYYPKWSRQRIFNCRICRECRVIENVFGISSVICLLRKCMLLEPEKASLVVLIVTLLHSFLVPTT